MLWVLFFWSILLTIWCPFTSSSNSVAISDPYASPCCVVFWLGTQSCLTLWDPMDVVCLAPLSMDSLGKNTKVGCPTLLQGIYATQGSNPGLPHCRQITVWATREAQFTLLTMLFHISLSLYLKFLFPLQNLSLHSVSSGHLSVQWTWVWANSGKQWRTGKPGMLQSVGLQRVRHNWAIELNW